MFVLHREGKESTRRKTFGAKTRTNRTSVFKSGCKWCEARALSTICINAILFPENATNLKFAVEFRFKVKSDQV